MAGGKRASMREGPLAALFKRTDVDAPDGRRARTRPSSGRRARARGSPSASASSTTSRTATPRGGARRARRMPEPQGAAQRRLLARHPARRARAPAGRAAEREYRPARRARDPARPRSHQPVLRVVGVGGAGVNAVNRMIEAGVEGVEFIAVNTDLQSLQQSAADVTLHIGAEITRGLGSGSDPKVGHAVRDLRRRPHQEPAEGLRHGVRRGRLRRRHRHGRGAGGRAHRAGDRRAHGRHRHEAVRLRGHAPRARRPTRASPSSPSTSTR